MHFKTNLKREGGTRGRGLVCAPIQFFMGARAKMIGLKEIAESLIREEKKTVAPATMILVPSQMQAMTLSHFCQSR